VTTDRRRRAAALSSILLGLGFGLPGVAGARHFAEHGEVWTFLGFPTYGDGPFTKVGIPTSTPLLLAFDVVCAAEVAVGVLLWRDHPAGRAAVRALLPAEAVFWAGFALPLGPPFGLLRTVLLRKPRR
jgi:hypothetical protein